MKQRPMVAASLLAALALTGGVMPGVESIPTGSRRSRKGRRFHDLYPERHEQLRADHMTSEKARTGMTGKQLRKAQKKARKIQLRAEGKRCR